MAARPGSARRLRAVVLEFPAVRESPTALEESFFSSESVISSRRPFSFSFSLWVKLPSSETFSVSGALLPPEFRSALGMLPSLKISLFLVLTSPPVFRLEWMTLPILQFWIFLLSPFSLETESLMQLSFSQLATLSISR